MSGEIALDTSVAVRFLNGDTAIVSRVHKKTYEVTAGGSGSGYFVTAHRLAFEEPHPTYNSS